MRIVAHSLCLRQLVLGDLPAAVVDIDDLVLNLMQPAPQEHIADVPAGPVYGNGLSAEKKSLSVMALLMIACTL
jgi:hypothetical protein